MDDSRTPHNLAVESANLKEWAARPRKFVAYYRFPLAPKKGREAFYPACNGAKVTTWLGSELGTITSACVYKHNFGSRMVALTVRGNNGAVYHGRASWDWGNVIRLHRSKG